MTKQQLFQTLPAIKTSDKILLLTHIDLDAAGAAIIMHSLFDNVDIQFCTNKTMDYDIKSTIMNNDMMSNYDMVIACDISCSAETAYIINHNKNKSKFILLDHHTTALALNENSWACVCTDLIDDSYRKNEYYHDKTGLESGASLLFNYMDFLGYTTNCQNLAFLKNIVHMIACYDTWDWANVFDNNQNMKDLNSLCDIYGLEHFIQAMLIQMKSNLPIFTTTDMLFITIAEEKIKNYIARFEKNFKTGTLQIDNKYYSIVTSYADKYPQETFARMKELHPKHDLYILHYGTRISIRTDTDINIAEFVANYGGGGHPGAGGFKISQETLQTQLEAVMNGTIFYN